MIWNNNYAGLKSKLETFDNVLEKVKPSVFMGQETKLNKNSQIKTKHSVEYRIFQLQRQEVGVKGGGLVLGVLPELEPVLIRQGDDEAEVISVLIQVDQMSIRLITAYGRQETDRDQDKEKDNRIKDKFWAFIDREIQEAEGLGQGVILGFDSNCHPGPSVVKLDPMPGPNKNGQRFLDFLERNPTILVVNSLKLCEGTVTRKRTTVNGIELSVLDFFLVNSRLKPFISKMFIDEKDEFGVANFVQMKKNKTAKFSDHHGLFMELQLSFSPIKPERIAHYNFRNNDCQNEFLNTTNNSTILSQCFENDMSFEDQAKKWRKTLENIFSKCFKKIRITSSNKKEASETSKLLQERRNLIKKLAKNPCIDNIRSQISEIEEKIGEEVCIKNRHMVSDNMAAFGAENGGTNVAGAWGLKKKFKPNKIPVVPVGKKDKNGNIVTEQSGLKVLYLETFIWRLRERPVRPDLNEVKSLKQKLFEKVMKLCKMTVSQPWHLEDLEEVLKSLKNEKCRDPHGLVNEIFKPNVAGQDLKKSMLKLFNKIKEQQRIPEFFKLANITAIYKGKGDMNDLINERGIFIVTIYRSILMKLINRDTSDVIETNMSDSQIGSRKNKNVRNHIWTVNAVITDVLSKKSKASIDVQVVDVKQCFDGLWTEECLNDMFRAGVQDDNLVIMHEASKVTNVAVKTPVGLTSRKSINNKILQGDVLGPRLCSVQIDSFGKECIEDHKYLYMYKGLVAVPPLAMVDDLICISECGPQTVQLNSYINYKASSKKLQFGTEKCKKMHIGQTKEDHKCKDLHIDGWKEEVVEDNIMGNTKMEDVFVDKVAMEEKSDEKYLGDIISNDGKNTKNIKFRQNKGRGMMNEIMAILEDIMYGKYHFEVAVMLRNALLVSSMLCNAEAWYNTTKADIEMLEEIDEQLLRKILNAHSKTPKEMLYLELGCIPIRLIMRSKRMNFLHYILNQPEKSTLKQILNQQIENPNPKDWIKMVEMDMKVLKIDLSLTEIKSMSKLMFKKLVKEKTRAAAMEYLTNLKKKHSKVKEIEHDDLEIQKYFLPDTVTKTVKQIQDLFKIRTRMLEIKTNMKGNHKEFNCDECRILGNKNEETQEHILNCPVINAGKEMKMDMNYSDIYSRNVLNQIDITKEIMQNMAIREQFKQITE